MNIALFAVIGILVLIIAVPVLKKISSGKKTAPAGTDEAIPESVEEAGAVDTVEPEVIEEPEAQAPEEPVEDQPEEPAEDIQEDEELTPVIEEEVLVEDPAVEQIEVEEELPVEPEAETLPPISPSVAIVDFSIKQYGERLRETEEAGRLAVADAVNSRDDKRRDALQLELVAVNEKLALLEEAYEQECVCYREILDILPRIGTGFSQASLEEAIRELSSGNPLKAEELLTSVMNKGGADLAVAAFHSGRLAECRFDLETALKRYTKAMDSDPENTSYRYVAGLIAKKMYRYPEAIKWLDTFISAQEGDASSDPIELAGVKRDLAHTYVVAGQSQKAGPLYKQAMTVFTEALGQDHPEMAACWFQIGELQETMGEYDKAVSLYKKSLAILDKTKGKNHPALSPVLAKLAALCMELELEKEAVPLYERLVAIREATLPPSHPQLEMGLNSLAESYRLQGMHAEAEGCYLKCLAIAEKTQGKESARVGAVLQELAKLSLAQRKNEEAEQYQARATAIFDKVVEEQEKQSQDSSLSLEL